MSGAQETRPPTASVRTFLVADIRGYSTFTKRHGDEAAARLVHKFVEVAAEGIAAWSGTLLETRGDEVLGVFVSPRSALHAAVELQDAFAEETAGDRKLPLVVGIGLDAGEAVPHDGGFRGAALNTAARLCGEAETGEVLASAQLVHLSGRVQGLTFEPSEPLHLRGYDEPVAAVWVRNTGTTSERSTVSDQASEPVGSPAPLPPELDPIVPLANRSDDILWLEWHWRRARHGRGRTVVVSGPPGMGKTRLAAELATRARTDAAALWYLSGARGADDPSLLEGGPAADPALIVVDDIDAAPEHLVSATVALSKAAAGRSALVVVIHRSEASPAIVDAAERLAPSPRRRELGPLDLDAVRMIAALYAGDAVDELPIARLVEETGGHPASVHRTAHQWSRLHLTQRIGRSAVQTATSRSGSRTAELGLSDDVVAFQRARERGSLLGLDDERDGVDADRTDLPPAGRSSYTCRV